MVFGRPIVLLLSCASTDANEERECVSYCEVEYKSDPNEEQRVLDSRELDYDFKWKRR